MKQTPPPGHDPVFRVPLPRDLKQASSFGGEGWQPRLFSHDEEMELGFIWRACGYRTEYAPLREVLLAWPGPELEFAEAPDRYLMLDRVHLPRIREQATAIAEFFRSHGVKAHFFKPERPPPPNFIFMRDLFVMTPAGAILARMAAQQRAGEERFAAEALVRLGVPLLAMARDRVTLEGADVLWMRPDTVLVGVEQRTNRAAFSFLSQFFSAMEVKMLAIPLPKGVQHLLGVVNFVDRDLAVVHGGNAPRLLRDTLERNGITTLVLQPDEELLQRRAMNFVTLEPRSIVMPSECPKARRRFKDAGIQVHELDVGEYLKAAGGLGCLTGILRRA